jgi:hypothetical protein
MKLVRDLAFELRAKYIWGITGTPDFNTMQHILISAEFLHAQKYNESFSSAMSIKNNLVRRNNIKGSKNIQLPPKIQKTIWCELTAQERVLYEFSLNRSRNEGFMVCSHYQIANQSFGGGPLDINVVGQKMVSTLRAQITASTARSYES